METITRLEPRRETTEVSAQVVTETDVRYLDADGDELLDTVEVVETLVLVSPGGRRVLSQTRVEATGIGDDGVPRNVVLSSAA